MSLGFDPTKIVKKSLPKKKYKILALCDHPMSASGVGTQAGVLFSGLIRTGKYRVVCLGGAIKHASYDLAQPHPDFIIKPVDGFGTKEQLRQLLLTEQPDVLFIFTDPRQFIWVWEMEDEIRQICPIAYWHVWDNDPYPKFNKVWYDSTDLINCLAHKTYELVKPNFPEKTHYIPHTFPKEMYHPLPKEAWAEMCKTHFPGKEDWFKVLWVNRNATRKLGGDVIDSFGEFLDLLEKKHGHRNAMLIMHTDPFDIEGPNLVEVSNRRGLQNNVIFSTEKLPPQVMNMLHNMCDTLINVAKNEGFGLSTLIQMMCGKPIITLCTGGETRQVIDYRDNSENGVALKPAVRQLVGSQMVPYIYEDFASHQQIVDAYMKIYEMTDAEKEAMKSKVLEYVEHEFNHQKMVDDWDKTLENTIGNFKSNGKKTWTLQPLANPAPTPKTKEEKTKVFLEQNNIEVSEEVKKLPIDLTHHLMKNVTIKEVSA